MTLFELRQLVRLRLRDNKQPYLISDDEINANLNDAQREACVRALLIEDDTNITINIDPDNTHYQIDPRIIDVIGISIGSDPATEYTNGWTLTENYLILDTAPSTDDVLTLHCYLLPSNDMVDDEDEPEIRPIYHVQMTDWAISLCYLIPDADMFNKASSELYDARFTRSFGERPSAALTMRNRRSKTLRSVANNCYI